MSAPLGIADPELRFLIDACLGDVHRQASRLEVPVGLNWTRILELCVRHRVAGLLASRIDQCGQALPTDAAIERIHAVRRAEAFQFLSQSAEMLRLVRRLEAANIDVIVLKGAPLATKLYAPHPEVRQSIDIDLLVAPDSFARAEQLLAEDGYGRDIPPKQIPSSAESMSRYLFAAYEYARPDTGDEVELHHRPLSDPHIFKAPIPELLANAEAIEVGDIRVKILGPAELPAFLCAHAASHLFFRLKWLADLTRLFDSYDQSELRRSLQRARELGCLRHVILALAVIEALTGRRYDVLTENERSSVSWLMARTLAAIAARERQSERFTMKDVPADFSEMLYGIVLGDSLSSRGFKLLQHMTNHQDLQSLGLGVEWSPVYALVGRPLALWRWLQRHAGPKIRVGRR